MVLDFGRVINLNLNLNLNLFWPSAPNSEAMMGAGRRHDGSRPLHLGRLLVTLPVPVPGGPAGGLLGTLGRYRKYPGWRRH